MAPLPQEPVSESSAEPDVSPIPGDDDIVITGISGLLPDCASYIEFVDKIYQKKNLVTANPRWKNIKHPELPEQCGRIADLDVFDAQFFTVFHKLAHSTEPLARKLFEQTYQAIFDAGVNPLELWGRKVGVFVGAELSEAEKMVSGGSVPLGIIGCCRSMYANRISYWLNLKGPSITMDGSSCSALLVLERAWDAIAKGYCDEAIVGCGKILMHPQSFIMYNRSINNYLNVDGVTKCYDDAADGHSFSEAATVMLLQKYKHAKRAYAVVRQVKVNFNVADIVVPDEIFRAPRDAPLLTKFFSQFYHEAGVSPSDVEYIEGFGAAIPEMDKLELQVMEQVFCKDRFGTLMVGSVASNTGFTEAASSACAIFKLLAAYQRGEIAATINCKNPRSDIAALHDGRMSILTENTPFRRSLTAVNSFAITGLNGHALLQGCYKPKDLSKYSSDIPYLVVVSGRQELAVQKILDDIKSRPLDPEEIALIHNFYKKRINNHLARGFEVYSTANKETTTHTLNVDYYDAVRRPLWFVYSGMGSQWIGMGRQLMRIPIFNEAIQRCHKILEPKGVNLIDVITSDDKRVFDNIMHSFVGIAAIQIGLTDILTAIGLVPDQIIGHSLGELGCAYVDGCFTAEDMILLAYTRGLVSIQTPLLHGSMAAVGMGYKSMSNICPPEIDVACHNSAESCTISGPAEAIKDFVEVLTKQGVFAKEVQCSNIPYHSRYIANAGPEFLRLSRLLVKEPKLRSAKWISSSVLPEQSDHYHSKYSSAEYHTNNLLHTVFFEEVLRQVPSNAVLVEIAPHGLLQAILKRALPSDCRNVALTQRGHKDNALFLLDALGKLFMEGYDLEISALYPKIEFPVSSETRPLSHLVEWAHGEKWKICEYLPVDRTYTSILKQLVTVEDDANKYLKGHYVEGVRVYPYAAALVAVWDAFAMSNGYKKKKISVQFSDVHFHSQPPLLYQQRLSLTVAVQKGSGRFEVFTDVGIIVEGFIVQKNVTTNTVNPDDLSTDLAATNSLNQDDIYKLFFEKGLEYKDEFRSVHTINTCMTHAEVKWHQNWVTFIDGVLQTCLLRDSQEKGTLHLNFVRKLAIDLKVHLIEESINGKKRELLKLIHSNTYNRTRCGGVTIDDVFYKSKPLTTHQSVALKTLKFQPFYQKDNNDVTTSIYLLMQVINEHVNRNSLIVYYINIKNRPDYLSDIKSVINSPPLADTKTVVIDKEDLLKSMSEKPDVIFMHDLLSDKTVLEALYKFIAPNTLLISTGVDTENLYPTTIYKPIIAIGTGRNNFELGKFRSASKPSHTTAVSVRNHTDYNHLHMLCNELSNEQKLLALTSYPAPSDLKKILKHWKTNNRNVSMVMFDQNDSMNKELENIPDVPVCALRQGVWGSDYYVPTKHKSSTSKKPVALRCKQPGNVDTLSWKEVEVPTGPGVDVTVHYAGLSVSDAKKATSEMTTFSPDSGFGMDFSGITARGDRVMGFIAEGAAASKVQAHPQLLWPVPAHWSLEDAATVPLAYAHAFYCLAIKCTMIKGLTVLVHGGTGALGQAAISIALANDCRVFTTVSDQPKKRFLKKLFPALKDDHIGNSRDSSFVDMIRKSSKKDAYAAGCDIVIGHAHGDIKNDFFNCVGFKGVAMDITQVVEQENYAFGMDYLDLDRSYYVTDLSSIFKQSDSLDIRKLQLLMCAGIERGYVQPLTRVTYEPHETARAFRLLAASRHRGRALLALQPGVSITQPRLSCRPDRSHLIVCDGEGLGLHLANTLINRGATKLHLHCQQTSYVKHKVENWERRGVKVDVSSESIANKEGVLQLLTNWARSGAVDDVYVMATDVVDKSGMTSFVANLDTATRQLSLNLRHFAVISEVDTPWREIIVKRTLEGLPSLSLQLEKIQKYEVQSQPDYKHETVMMWQNAISAIESALASGDSVVLAHVQPAPKLSLLEEIARIPGVNITNATVDRTTLEQVGFDQGRAQELSHILEKRFNKAVSKDVLPAMTIAEIKKLEKQTMNVNIEQEPEGFAAYFSRVLPDDLSSTSELVFMQTLVHKTKLRADEFDMEHDYLCVLPGLDGRYEKFDTLCERLKIPAAILQLDDQHLDETLEEMAQRRANIIMHKLKPKRSFYLLGYEFGVLVALEIAAILERNGLTGTVYMLGGTPKDICNSFNYRWRDTAPEAMQDALITHMFTLITGIRNINFANKLRNTTSWTDKVNLCIKHLRTEISYSTQYMEGVIRGAYARIRLLQNYQSKQYSLRSKLVLLRAKLMIPQTDDLKQFPKQMEVHDLRSTLAHATQDLACTNLINKFLHKDILEEFENSNQCDNVNNNDDFLHLKLVDHENVQED